MSRLRMISAVAAFEFLRVFKPKDVLVSLVLFSCGGLFLAWIHSDEDPVKVPVVVLGDAIKLENADHLPFTFLESVGEDEADLRKKVGTKERGTVVIVRSIDDIEIVIRDTAPRWYPQLLAEIESARRVARVRTSGLQPEKVESVLASGANVALSVQSPKEAEEKGKQEFLAYLCIAAMLLGVFIGNVHLFTGITGEKQNRVTESIMSSIPAQTWIDGKLVGLSLVAFFGLVTLAACWMVANQLYGLFLEPVHIPFEIINVGLFLAFLLLTGLGFLLWFAFFGAIAATIDDPNTSSRSVFMFVPVLALAIAFPGIDSPDDGAFRFASLFPLTAPAVMPVRLVMGNPAAWEVLLACVFLILSIWLLRRLAGKVFALGMLMHGAEPSWRDMWRAFKES